MSKKAQKKAAKPLASALSVANPVEYLAVRTQAQTPKPAGVAPTPKPPSVTETVSAVPSTPPPSKSEKEPALRAEAPTPTLSQPAVPAVFGLYEPHAERVWLSGEFNEWSSAATPLKPRGGGRWETVLPLRPGRYQYKFVVDGNWMPDPEAREQIPNPYGSVNSVIDVRN